MPKIGQFWANSQSKKNFFLKIVLKSPIILLKFSQKLHQNRQILGPNFYRLLLPRQTEKALKTFAAAIAVAVGMYKPAK